MFPSPIGLGPQPPVRLVRADHTEEIGTEVAGAGYTYISATNDTTELFVPVAFCPFPSLQFHGYLHFLDTGYYSQWATGVGATAGQGLVIQLQDNGTAYGPAVTFFDTGSEIPHVFTGSGYIAFELTYAVVGSADTGTKAWVKFRIMVTDSTGQATVADETKTWVVDLDPTIDHDIGYSVKKAHGFVAGAAGAADNAMYLRSFTGTHVGQRSAS